MESTGEVPPAVTDEKTVLQMYHVARNGEAIEIVPMRYRDLLKGAESLRKAFLNDPLMRYFVTADTAPFQGTRSKAINIVDWVGAMRQHRMVTIGGGLSLMKYGPPGNQNNLAFIAYLMKTLKRLRPQECAKRWKEFGAKAQMLVVEAFGNKVGDMYEIQALCTDPDAQGRGYASALVEYVLKQGDADGHDVWLLATDAYGFYEHFGFTVIRSGMIAVDNPAWDGEPITLYIMHRPAVTLTPRLKERISP
ncbi:hypothetical protein GSI_00940 [Ganoderma sinense ZZ0214-1]|uniref:N-acetyltransferase domain-containing protein n=1 Tax=Ganoderma sinense ZZ0214-1 TaxID=1077348 RepID=A0A2G8SU01_9APHY|nr:hypothetical protein GSI_00940 [Ganoderma sinense ZZ0214-1]